MPSPTFTTRNGEDCLGSPCVVGPEMCRASRPERARGNITRVIFRDVNCAWCLRERPGPQKTPRVSSIARPRCRPGGHDLYPSKYYQLENPKCKHCLGSFNVELLMCAEHNRDITRSPQDARECPSLRFRRSRARTPTSEPD